MPESLRPKHPWNSQLAVDSAAANWATDLPAGIPRPQAEPISLASVWQMPSAEAAEAALTSSGEEFVYRRDGHPNARTLAEKLAQVHRAQRAVVTAQGMSSIAAIALALLKPGSRVWIGHELYGKSLKLFSVDMTRWQVEVRTFDPTDSDAIAELAMEQVDLVMVETISNPRVRVADLPKLAEAAHAAGATLVCDNTFATHLICQPLTLGADLVVESLSKQVNGHSDSMLGLVVGNDDALVRSIAETVTTFGMASSPMDCYLTHRGLLSIGVRVERACHNALALANALTEIDSIELVDYPGLPEHPQHRLAAEQLHGGFGWMLAFNTQLNRSGVEQLIRRLGPEIPFLPSLGDVGSTISHPASTSHRGLAESARAALGIGEGTIRVSCGIEPTEWLVRRFCEALK